MRLTIAKVAYANLLLVYFHANPTANLRLLKAAVFSENSVVLGFHFLNAAVF
ncbi:hypothetical protein [Ekhidna sp.]